MTAGRRRSMEEFLQQQRAMEAGDDAGTGPPAPSARPTVISPGSLPDPYTATADGQLSDHEHADLAACEAAVDNLRVAFWAAGKALQVIRDARLYRGTHATFEDYAEQRWDVSRSQAYRLIDAWPLAERLSPMGDTLNERQIRELLPLAGRHGQDAAVTVYRAVAETDGVQVTAAVLHGAVSILPAAASTRTKPLPRSAPTSPDTPAASPGITRARWKPSPRRRRRCSGRCNAPPAAERCRQPHTPTPKPYGAWSPTCDPSWMQSSKTRSEPPGCRTCRRLSVPLIAGIPRRRAKAGDC